MTVIPKETIKKNLIEGKDVNWDYLRDLRELDRQDGTENYVQAMCALHDEGILISNPREGYFIHFPGLGRSEPLIHGNLFYFQEVSKAGEFSRRFHPSGLVARVI